MAKGESVCVTGASGFIGAWVVKTLLENGYYVNATVQSLEDENETKHLKCIAEEVNAEERLELFQVELLDYSSLAAAIKGCSGVFHLACPNVIGKVQNPKVELVDPAVEGTLNVLKASKAASVKRVVVTSSISAMIPNPNWPRDKPVDEDCWCDLDYCHKNELWYPISKTLAEKETWKFVVETGMDVVAINPGTVLGPIYPPFINSSTAMLLDLFKGNSQTYGDFWMGFVHVKDVAKAQMMLYENPNAKGRHLCLSKIMPYKDFAVSIKSLFLHYPIHDFAKAETCNWSCKEVNDPAKKLIELGMKFTPMEQTIKDAVRSLIEKSFLPNLNIPQHP